MHTGPGHRTATHSGTLQSVAHTPVRDQDTALLHTAACYSPSRIHRSEIRTPHCYTQQHATVRRAYTGQRSGHRTATHSGTLQSVAHTPVRDQDTALLHTAARYSPSRIHRSEIRTPHCYTQRHATVHRAYTGQRTRIPHCYTQRHATVRLAYIGQS